MSTDSLRKVRLTGAEAFWYVLECIAFGAGYFSKVPAKKAMSDYGLCEMTGAEQFWYVLQCIFFGAGYFAKLPVAKALAELPATRQALQAGLVSPHATAPSAALASSTARPEPTAEVSEPTHASHQQSRDEN